MNAIHEIKNWEVSMVIWKKCFKGNDNNKATCGMGTLHTKNAHKNRVMYIPYVVPFWYACKQKINKKTTDNILNIVLFTLSFGLLEP